MAQKVRIELQHGGPLLRAVTRACPSYTDGAFAGAPGTPVLTGLRVERTPLELPPGAIVGAPFCRVNPVACCPPPCCAGYTLPKVVLLTITGSVGPCPNYAGKTFPLLWDDFYQLWQGCDGIATPGASQTTLFSLRCANWFDANTGARGTEFQLFASTTGANWSVGTHTHAGTDQLVLQSCAPLALAGNMSPQNGNPFNCGGTAVTLDFTLTGVDDGAYTAYWGLASALNATITVDPANTEASCDYLNGLVVPLGRPPGGRCWDGQLLVPGGEIQLSLVGCGAVGGAIAYALLITPPLFADARLPVPGPGYKVAPPYGGFFPNCINGGGFTALLDIAVT